MGSVFRPFWTLLFIGIVLGFLSGDVIMGIIYFALCVMAGIFYSAHQIKKLGGGIGASRPPKLTRAEKKQEENEKVRILTKELTYFRGGTFFEFDRSRGYISVERKNGHYYTHDCADYKYTTCKEMEALIDNEMYADWERLYAIDYDRYGDTYIRFGLLAPDLSVAYIYYPENVVFSFIQH